MRQILWYQPEKPEHFSETLSTFYCSPQSGVTMERILLGVLVLSGLVILSTCLPLQPAYRFVNQALNWTEAQSYCRRTHTDLATVLSSEEKNRIMKTLSSAGHSSDIWIGLFSEIDWRWSDGFTGSGADYRHWRTSASEPSFHYSIELCVMFSYYVEWYDVSCSQNRQFVCYKGSQLVPEFVFVNLLMNWSSAQTYCRNNFIDLATIKNDTDNKKVESLVPGYYSPWIGLFRDPNFHWSDGSSVVFTSWDLVMNPLGSMTVICGATSYARSGNWKFLPCETQLPFVCYDSPVIQKVVKIRLRTDNSVDLNDPVLRENILTKLQNRLQETGEHGFTLKWTKQPDGNVFRKEMKYV
ncbi:macrophage mannose receptor 1-like [Gambusia affinis]|uniref:macrophage mannose receptor 1-like n=1 Tax=Gambusia affinis TaxID=33528 RepID=UPI001CDB9CC7|nr:macrophage mannose receptor 1-like [Gambusia affinis]